MKVQEALKAAEKLIVKAIMFESEAEQYLSESNYELNGCLGDSAADISVNGKAVLAKVRAALAEIEKCEPVALVALNNAALQKRVEVLEDLLTSAASIASRNGEGTHWERFIGQLKVNGIGNITAKTFRVLPSDEGYTSPISKEREPAAEALHERNRLGYAVVDVIGTLDEIIENAQEVEVDDFLHIAIPIDKWHELQDALEEMPKRAELYTSPISKEWVGLNWEDLKALVEVDGKCSPIDFSRKVESKLKQLNAAEKG